MFSIIPDNLTIVQTLVYLSAFAGIILFPYSVFLEKIHRKDLVQMLAACFLLVYAIYTKETIFIIVLSAIAIASVVEFIEIYLGLHRHAPEELHKYKKIWRNKK